MGFIIRNKTRLYTLLVFEGLRQRGSKIK